MACRCTSEVRTRFALLPNVLVLLLCSVSADDWINGRATYYDDNQQGSCKFYADIPEWYGAWPDTMEGFQNSCGSCWEVSCVNGNFNDGYGAQMQRDSACYDENKSVVIKIVDSCPCVHQNFYSNQRWCCGDMKHLDLGRRTMEELADLKWGVIGLKWRSASCDNLGPRYISDGSKQPTEPPADDGTSRKDDSQSGDSTDSSGDSNRSGESNHDSNQDNSENNSSSNGDQDQPDSNKDKQDKQDYTVVKKGGTTTVTYHPDKNVWNSWSPPKKQESFGDLLSKALVGDSSSGARQKSFGELLSGALLGQSN